QQRLGSVEAPGRWLEWLNRPREFVSPACLRVLTGHTGTVYSVAVTGDGRTAVSGADDGTVRVWDLASGRCCAVHARGSVEARQVWAATQADRPFAIEKKFHVVILHSTGDGAVLARLPGQFTEAACSPDGRHVIAGDGAGGVYLLRLHTRP